MKNRNNNAQSKYIMYLDANNLHGWAMSQYLPTGNFKWITDKEISKIDLGKYKMDGKKGLTLYPGGGGLWPGPSDYQPQL